MNPYLAELLGTMLLVLFGDGVVANVVLSRSKGQNSGWIVIAAGWAGAVTIAVYAVNALSGAHLNPAVTIGLATIGTFPWSKVAGYVIAQIIGAFLGALMLSILQDGFNLIGISANPLPIIFGGAILVAMIANVQLARLRRAGRAR